MMKHMTPKRGLADYSRYRLVGNTKRLKGVPSDSMEEARNVDAELAAHLAAVGPKAFNAQCAAIDAELVTLARRRHRRPTDPCIVRAVVRRRARSPAAALCVLAASMRVYIESRIAAGHAPA